MKVKTGFGYIVDSEGKVVCKAELPAGDHPMKDGYTYVEVASKKDLDSVVVWHEPKEVKTEREHMLEEFGLTEEDLENIKKLKLKEA